MIKNITTSVTSLNDNKYLVAYTVAFTKPCRCFENSNQRARIKINSEKEFFADGADTAVLMMNKTINVLGEHKRSKQYDGIDLCGLDLRGGIGASYMIRDESSASLWRLVWAAADNTIIKKQFEFYKRSQGQLTQYKGKKSEILSKGWELGEDFADAKEKNRATTKVGEALVIATKNSVTKATAVMAHLVSKLSQSEHFDENDILTDEKKKHNTRIAAMIKHASNAIDGMSGVGKKGATTKQSIGIMTSVSALFLPSSGVPLRWACERLGLNRKAKYVTVGMANRVEYDKCISLSGLIAVGEMVQCRGGYGVLKEINEGADSVTITMHPWMQDTKYCPSATARMTRYEPHLMEYERKTRSDVFPPQWIDAIVDFHHTHNHPSPNAKDQVCRRHPQYPRQKEYAPVIYRYETFDQLWIEFQKEHVAIAVKIRNPNQPNECPTALRAHAPWNMIKGKDASCLCINCEGTNAVIRGLKGALKLIMQVLEHNDTDEVEGSDNTVPEQSPEELEKDDIAYAKLGRINNILGKPSKYDKCVSCLPCLTTKRLEDAKHKCIVGSCEVCGFDKLWKHGVQARIFVQEYDNTKGEWVARFNPNSKLATAVWLEQIEWRDYNYRMKPTVASHAQEVARQAAMARPPDDGDLDYEPTKNASARNLVLETRRGTLVDFLDHFETKIESHIELEHRNLVSSEHRSKSLYS